MFDQQAFTEAVGITAAAIAQVGIVGSQGEPSNLQSAPPPDIHRGRRHDGGKPLVYADRERTGGYGDHLRYDQD